MTDEIRAERRILLERLRQAEQKRCNACQHAMYKTRIIHCGCPAAVEIRAIGDALIQTTSVKRRGRIEGWLQDAKENGLTPELYRTLREHEVTIKDMRKCFGWTQRDMLEWRTENGFVKTREKQSVEVKRRRGNIAEQLGLSLEVYKKEVQNGLMDKEIRVKYGISAFSLLQFKKKHNLVVGRGQHKRKKVNA